jgi:uncharacterized protein (DUF433 family)
VWYNLSMSTVTYPHIDVHADREPFITRTGFKVRVLAEEHLATGAEATELRQNHPELTLAEIYSALAYYYDHKEEIDREIAELNQLVAEMRAEQGESLFARKLRELGKELP